MDKLSVILKHTKNYFGSSILVQALGFLAIPFFTSVLSNKDFGIASVFTSLLPIISTMTVLNAHSSVTRYYYEDKNDFNKFLGSTMLLMALLFTVTTSIILLMGNKVTALLNLPHNILVLLLFSGFSMALLSIYNQIQVVEKKSLSYMGVTVTSSYFKVILAITFLLLFSSTYYYKVLGESIAYISVGAFVLYKIIPIVKFSFSKEHIKYVLKFCIPLIPHSMSGFLLNSFDQLMINSTTGNVEAGMYGLAYSISILMLVFNNALLNSVNPDFFSYMKDDNHKSIINQTANIVKLNIIAVFIIICFSEDVAKLIINESYHQSFRLIPIISLGYLFFGFYKLFNRIFFYKKKTLYISSITIFCSLLNIGLNYYYIPIYGFIAAAYTTLASFILMFIIGYLISVFNLKTKHLNMKTFLIAILILAVNIIAIYYINENLNLILRIILKLILTLGVIAVFYYKKIIHAILGDA